MWSGKATKATPPASGPQQLMAGSVRAHFQVQDVWLSVQNFPPTAQLRQGVCVVAAVGACSWVQLILFAWGPPWVLAQELG